MIFLQKEKYDLCLVFLQKADAYACSLPKYLAITLNNKACYYRKTGKHRTALQCLQDALSLEWKSGKHDTLADTYLNLCAVLSQLGRHR
jgi:tetratricopeptide (TPR) repeat protein